MKPVSGKQPCKSLERNGWILLRINPSHQIYGRPDLSCAHFQEMLAAALWFIATDADIAGDKVASGWPTIARRPRTCSPCLSLPLNAGDRPETIPALTTEEAGPIDAADPHSLAERQVIQTDTLNAWPHLPEAIRAGIPGMAKANQTT